MRTRGKVVKGRLVQCADGVWRVRPTPEQARETRLRHKAEDAALFTALAPAFRNVPELLPALVALCFRKS